MDNVITNLQTKLQNLKTQKIEESKNETDTEIPKDFKNTLRKFSAKQSEQQGENGFTNLNTTKNRTSKKATSNENENGIKIVDGKEEFTIKFDDDNQSKLAFK